MSEVGAYLWLSAKHFTTLLQPLLLDCTNLKKATAQHIGPSHVFTEYVHSLGMNLASWITSNILDLLKTPVPQIISFLNLSSQAFWLVLLFFWTVIHCPLADVTNIFPCKFDSHRSLDSQLSAVNILS